MIINDKTINTPDELLNNISNGLNPLDFISNIEDIDFIAHTITHPTSSTDIFFNDTSEILLKSIILYLLATDSSSKNLEFCKDLISSEINNVNQEKTLSTLFNSLNFDHPAKMSYASIEILPPKTYLETCKVLSTHLSLVLKK